MQLMMSLPVQAVINSFVAFEKAIEDLDQPFAVEVHHFEWHQGQFGLIATITGDDGKSGKSGLDKTSVTIHFFYPNNKIVVEVLERYTNNPVTKFSRAFDASDFKEAVKHAVDSLVAEHIASMQAKPTVKPLVYAPDTAFFLKLLSVAHTSLFNNTKYPVEVNIGSEDFNPYMKFEIREGDYDKVFVKYEIDGHRIEFGVEEGGEECFGALIDDVVFHETQVDEIMAHVLKLLDILYTSQEAGKWDR
jgi:hypothetical protein